jgi:peptidoglycan/xylan/chitin deacetylase (PgdA/CDA1 family)
MSVILMYHRIGSFDSDPYGLAVHPDRFAEHLEHLRRLGSTVPLLDAVEEGGSAAVAITFDDGYADNATLAAPMVAEAGLPATWFITSGQLGRRRFWWDRLAEGLLGPHAIPDSVDVEVAGRGLWLDLRSTTARRTAMFFLHRRLSALPPDAIEDAVDRILGRLEAPEPVADNLTMTVAQLRVLADLPLQDVGAHTRTHLRLRGQDPELQREEILGSVVDLVELLDRPVDLFAYPFGGSSAVGSVAPRLAAEAGCSLAVSTDEGAVDGRSDRYRLPRLNVQNWHGDEFADRLDELMKVR